MPKIKITIPRKQLFRIRGAISMLDGKDQTQPVRDVKGNILPTPPNKLVPYQFDGMTARMNLSRNADDIDEEIEAINKVKQEKLVQLSPNREPIEPGTEAHKEFNTWWDEMLESEVEIELRTVQYLKLNPEKNGIPMEVIASLGKMVEYPTDEELAALEESQKKKEV